MYQSSVTVPIPLDMYPGAFDFPMGRTVTNTTVWSEGTWTVLLKLARKYASEEA